MDADIKQVTYSNFIIFIKNSHWALILTFGIKAVHHRLNNVQFGLDGEVYKVCVNQNVVWWAKLSVVLKKEARWVLSPAQKSKKWNQIHDQTLFNDPMRISVSWLTYTSLSFSCEGSFFFFSFALARSVSFLQNKRWVVAAFYVGSGWSNESHGSKAETQKALPKLTFFGPWDWSFFSSLHISSFSASPALMKPKIDHNQHLTAETSTVLISNFSK